MLLRQLPFASPSLGVLTGSGFHEVSWPGAFCFQRVAPAGDVACQECRGQRYDRLPGSVWSNRAGKTWKTKALRTVLALGAGLIDNLGRDSERFK